MAKDSYLSRLVDKGVLDIGEGEITKCKRSGRYRGTSVGRDKNGFFACTHRARSRSYPSPGDIPDSVLRFIKSTG